MRYSGICVATLSFHDDVEDWVAPDPQLFPSMASPIPPQTEIGTEPVLDEEYSWPGDAPIQTGSIQQELLASAK